MAREQSLSHPARHERFLDAFATDEWLGERHSFVRWYAVGLVIFGLVLIFLGDGEEAMALRLRYFLAGLVSLVLALFVWLWASRQSSLVALGVGSLLVGQVILATIWLQNHGALLFAPLPVVLLLLAGYPRVAVGGLLVWLLWIGAGPYFTSFSERMLAASAMLATVLATWGAQRSMIGRARWAWRHYLQAQHRLEETRDRKQELDSVLEELLHANRQLDLLNERLAAARTHAEEMQQSKAAFVAKVSHEFRTPLNMIIGMIDLVLETPHIYADALPPLLHDDLLIVHRNCEHLSSMINDVLDLSQTEAGRLTLQRQIGDLNDDVRHAVEVVRPLADKKGLALHLSLPDAPVLAALDQTRIRQVLLNLLSNAARYTSTGSITVGVSCDADSVIIDIADTGPGIDDADLMRIFEPFFQTSSLHGRSQSGTGLGLSISRQFVELHGGKLWVESEVGRGSTFYLRLPTQPPVAPPAKPERWIQADWVWHERVTRGPRPELPRLQRYVLYDSQESAHPLLDLAGEEMELVTAVTLDEAAALAADGASHALLINAGDGAELLPMLTHSREVARSTPIIGWTLPSPLQSARAAGAVDYLVKPVTRADLFGVLDDVPTPLRRVLVVDDEEDVQKLITRMIHSYAPQATVVCVADSDDAIRVLESAAPDVILLDLMLRRGTGWDVLAYKQRSPTLAALPAIIVSAQDPMEGPPLSPLLAVTQAGGLSAETLLRVTQALLNVLLPGSPALPPTHVENPDDGQV